MAFQRGTVKIGGGGQQRVKRRIRGLPRFLASDTLFAGYFHASGFGQILDGLGEIQVVVVHDEAEGIATRATTEAVIKLLVGTDAERRCLFLVERTAGAEVLAGFL